MFPLLYDEHMGGGHTCPTQQWGQTPTILILSLNFMEVFTTVTDVKSFPNSAICPYHFRFHLMPKMYKKDISMRAIRKFDEWKKKDESLNMETFQMKT